MKSTVISSAVITSCAILAAATPTFSSENAMIEREQADELDLFVRAGAAAKSAAGKFLEKQFTDPTRAMGMDDRKKNRDNAIDIALGRKPFHGGTAGPAQGTLKDIQAQNAAMEASRRAKQQKNDGMASAHQASQRSKHQMDATSAASQAYKKYGKRDFDFDELDLFVRAGAAAKAAAGKFLEKQFTDPTRAMGMDDRKKNRDNAIDIALGRKPFHGGTAGPAQGTLKDILAQNAAMEASRRANQQKNDAIASAHQASQRSKHQMDATSAASQAYKKYGKRDLDFDELDLFVRAGAAAKAAAGKFLEKQFTDPTRAMGMDDRKKNRDNAIDLAMGRKPFQGGGVGPAHGTLRDIQAQNAAMEASRRANKQKNDVMASAHQASQRSKQQTDATSAAFQAHKKYGRRAFDDEELDLFARGNTGSKAAKEAGKQIEKKVLNPQRAMGSDKKEDVKESAKDAVTGGKPLRGGSTSPIQKTIKAISAANAFQEAGRKAKQEKNEALASAHQASQKNRNPKRAFEVRDFEDELFAREYELDELE